MRLTTYYPKANPKTIPKLKCTVKRAYLYIAPTKWNAIPLNIRLVINPIVFKIRVKKYLIDRN